MARLDKELSALGVQTLDVPKVGSSGIIAPESSKLATSSSMAASLSAAGVGSWDDPEFKRSRSKSSRRVLLPVKTPAVLPLVVAPVDLVARRAAELRAAGGAPAAEQFSPGSALALMDLQEKVNDEFKRVGSVQDAARFAWCNSAMLSPPPAGVVRLLVWLAHLKWTTAYVLAVAASLVCAWMSLSLFFRPKQLLKFFTHLLFGIPGLLLDVSYLVGEALVEHLWGAAQTGAVAVATEVHQSWHAWGMATDDRDPPAGHPSTGHGVPYLLAATSVGVVGGAGVVHLHAHA